MLRGVLDSKTLSMRNFHKQNNLKTEKSEKIVIGISILFSFLAIIASSFYEEGSKSFCAYLYRYYYIYADSPGYVTNLSCDGVQSGGMYLSIFFLIVAMGAGFLIILRREDLRNLFIRFLRIFIPAGVLILGYGVLSSFCLMMSCTDGLEVAARIDGIVFLLVFFSIAWSGLLPVRYSNFRVLFFFVIPFVLWTSYDYFYKKEQQPIRDVIYAIENQDVTACPTISENLNRSCIEQVAIGLRDLEVCGRLNKESRVFCINGVREQIALDKIDPLLCKSISDTRWEDNCEDRISYQKKKKDEHFPNSEI